MSVLKVGSVSYSGGVDISNRVEVHRRELPVLETEEAPATHEPDREKLLDERESRIARLEAELSAQRRDLDMLKEQYIQQGKEVILEAKRRADGIVSAAQQNAEEIAADAENNRESVFIKAKAEGFEQGRKDGVEACLAQGKDILDEAKAYSERIITTLLRS